MRKLIYICLFICIYANAQDYTNELGQFQYKYIDSTELSKKDLNSIITKWCAVNLNNSNYSVKLSNEDNIVVKTGSYIKARGQKTFVEFTLDFAFKDGKYKIEAYDFPLVMTTLGYETNIYNPDYYTEDIYRKESLEMIERMSLGKNMAKKRMENEKVFKKYYALQLDDMTKLFNQTKDIVDNISMSIKKDLSNKKSEW